MANSRTPRVYLDADVFVSVLRGEPNRQACLEALEAADRRDIRLVASRFLPVEIGGWRGNRPGRPQADALISQYLDGVDAEWVEVDLLVAREARRLSWEHHLRPGDAIHLATAIRRGADYFMTHDHDYPLGETVEGVELMEPGIVWQPTLDGTT